MDGIRDPYKKQSSFFQIIYYSFFFSVRGGGGGGLGVWIDVGGWACYTIIVKGTI